MNKNSFAIIGGSGLYEIDGAKIIEEIAMETPFGKPSSSIKKIDIDGSSFYFLARHGEAHNISPSEINYRANIFALKKLGVDFLISISAVGSLREELAPTHMVLPDQFIDRTIGIRKKTFFENGIVAHLSMANPINKVLQKYLFEACKRAETTVHAGGTYICIEGPQFSTSAESHLYRQWGASIIGMTNIPEAHLAKEAGLAYATIAMVTDYDGWKDEHCTLEEVMSTMKENKKSFHKILQEILAVMGEEKISFEKENQNIIVSSKEGLSSSQKEWLDILLAP